MGNIKEVLFGDFGARTVILKSHLYDCKVFKVQILVFKTKIIFNHTLNSKIYKNSKWFEIYFKTKINLSKPHVRLLLNSSTNVSDSQFVFVFLNFRMKKK